ncbi:uncharacterized protein LOC105436016 [Cucumis sativus]|uniref:Uncharacterized protein n=1 Tax=Cucumis sativus TaxID=3659 RepID=A0A0A0KK43_CUCSA|nr:uncharacterized protein LOC105436016 [Cucumis sativus]KGN48131.1 hypothetical protein Csa_004357 [Cucumis sativus]
MKQLSKSISSPSRTDLFPPPLMSFLRADAGNRSKSSRSRSSPIFVGKKNVAIETQEPSSPKVTCMGQVRTNKHSSNKTPAVRCRWIRSVLSFNRRHCRTFWNRSAMLCRGKREIRRISESRVGNEAEDSEKDEEEDDGRDGDAVYSSFSVPSPPKNALILSRCRSAPNRSSFNGTRYRSSSITSDGTVEVEEEEKTEGGFRNNAASKIELGKSERLLKKVESSKGDGDSKSVNGNRNLNLILTRSKSEPGRIAEKLYGELNNLQEEKRWVMNKKKCYILNNNL